MVPYDVLVDPRSLPDHPVLQDQDKVDMLDIVREDTVDSIIEGTESQKQKSKEVSVIE